MASVRGNFLALLHFYANNSLLVITFEPVAQRQEMVSGTLALLNGLSWAGFYVSRASAPKGDKVLQNTGGICTSVGLLLKGFLGALIDCLEAGKGLVKGLSGAVRPL